MKKLLALSVGIFTVLSLFAQKDKYAGYYEGNFVSAKSKTIPNLVAQVYRTPNERYRIRLYSKLFEESPIHWEADYLKEEDGSINVEGSAGKIQDSRITFAKKGATLYNVNIKLTPEGITGSCNLAGKQENFELKKSTFVSPTMAEKAPKGAIVLFDGEDTSKWVMGANKPISWEVKDSAMTIKAGTGSSIRYKEAFGAFKLHLEFKSPAEYDVLDFRKGNSGVYVGPYEVQILESFGEPTSNRHLGAIYTIAEPLVNASLEPEAWQTLDIEFTPAKYEGSELKSLPRFTVYVNGVLVQDNVEVKTPTNAASKKNKDFKHPEKVSIVLQDHAHAVSFRNIWLEKR